MLHKKTHKKVEWKFAESDEYDDSYELTSYDSLIKEATIKGNQNDFAGEKKFLQKAIKMDPRNRMAYIHLGILYYKFGMVEEAIHTIKQCLERDAFDALTGRFGDDAVSLAHARRTWAGDVGLLLNDIHAM